MQWSWALGPPSPFFGGPPAAKPLAMTQARPKPRPLLAALLLGFLAEALFVFRLGFPHKQMFDEIYYVPAAKALWALSAPVNIEHPLVGKELIGLGIHLFGDTSFGWRFPSTIAASAVVMGVFAIGWLTFGRMRPAVIAALLTIVNMTVFIQARIAMLDGFMAAFLVLSVAAMLWAMRGPRWIKAKTALAAVLLGLAAGAKWTAVPFLGFAGLAIVAIRIHDGRKAGRDLEAALYARGQAHWPGVGTLPLLLIVGVVSVATYLATFAHAFFYAERPLKLDQIAVLHRQMLALQTQPLPPHTYQSSPWQWPLITRPIWYLYESVEGVQRGVLLVGNPAVMWGGLVALAACLWDGAKDRRPALLGLSALYIVAMGVWLIIPKKIGFYYYYYFPALVLPLLIAAVFHNSYRRQERWLPAAFMLLTFGLFAYFYPIISSQALPNDRAFEHWMWLSTWP